MARAVQSPDESLTEHQKVARRKKVDLGIRQLRRFYRQGVKLQRIRPAETGRMPHGKEIIPRKAAKLGVSRDRLERARQFADEFSTRDVSALCQWSRQSVNPLQISILIRSTVVKPHRKRLQLLHSAIREGWTTARFSVEISRLSKAATRSGRPRRMPQDEKETREQICGRLRPQLNWLKALRASMTKSSEASPSTKAPRSLKVPAGPLEAEIDAAIRAIHALVTVASEDG